MAEDNTPLHDRQRVLRRLQEEARIRGGNDAIVRACMVGFGIAIASIAPVTWDWKIALFLLIMLLVGIIIPAIWRARENPK
jgi:type IV secretory pathway TrbD component